MMNYENRLESWFYFLQQRKFNNKTKATIYVWLQRYVCFTMLVVADLYIDAITGEVSVTIKHLGEYSHGKQSNASTATNKVQFQQLWL
jgi:hypothetical protein